MRMAKIRINLSVNEDVWNRAKALFSSAPGAPSISLMVENFLHQTVIAMEPIVDLAKKGDKEAMFQVLQLLAAKQTEEMGVALASMRTGAIEKGGEVVTKKSAKRKS